MENHYAIRSPALFGQTVGIHSAAVFFIAGAIAGAVLLLDSALILAGLRRKGTRQHPRDRKETKNAGRDRDQAQQKNEKLRDRLDRDDTGTSSAGAAAAD